MASEKQMQVLVLSAANGYMVRPSDSVHSDRCFTLNETHVFETFESMVKHLREVLPAVEKKR